MHMEGRIGWVDGRMVLIPITPCPTPEQEERAADWIVRLDDALRSIDPTLGALDFGERLMPARFGDDGPTERYDRLTAVLATEGSSADYRGVTYHEPEALARAWAGELRGRGTETPRADAGERPA